MLYTDADVLWARDPAPYLKPPRPTLLAAAAEGLKGGFNTGVLWMNVPALLAEHAALIAFGDTEKWKFSLYDQTLLNEYNSATGKRMNKLPDQVSQHRCAGVRLASRSQYTIVY